MTTTLATGTHRRTEPEPGKPVRHWHLKNLNWFGGTFGWLWLVIVMLPIYWIVITSFKAQSSYFGSNPLAPPTEPTMTSR